LIENSRQLIALRNDSKFKSDFKMIRKKQDSISQIKKLEESMFDLKSDLLDPGTKTIYDNLEFQIKEMNNKLLNETGFESWETDNASRVDNLLKDAVKAK